MRSLFLFGVFGAFLSFGLVAPFIAGLGYIWVDIVSPQRLAYSLISGASLSKYMAIATIFLYFAVDRKSPPRVTKLLVALAAWGLWITLTTTWAEVPDDAWIKWDWAFKGIAFSLFVPFLFRSRVQLEAFLLVVILSAACHFLPAAAKTLLGSGGYRSLALLSSDNRGLGETSTLALFSVMLLPLMHFARKHSLILTSQKFRDLMFWGFTVAVIAAVVGTFSRTGLVALMVYGVLMIVMRDHKVRNLSAVALVSIVAISITSSDWKDRMGTITAYGSDSSAQGRLAVWAWTIDYALANPLGGGFEVHSINEVEVVTVRSGESISSLEGARKVRRSGKAFHSIYFEVLGEHGIVGFLLYIGLFGGAVLTLLRLSRQRDDVADSQQWLPEMATALLLSLTIYLVGGAFVGIAFQPYSYYWIGLTVALQQYGIRTGSRDVILRRHGRPEHQLPRAY